MNIDEYILHKTRKNFDFVKAYQLFNDCKTIREEWDDEAEIGALIYGNKYLVPKDGKSEFYVTNFVRDNLMLSLNQSIVPGIDVRLENNKFENTPLQDSLELELNYIVDREKIFDDVRQIMISKKFMGFGFGKVYWSQDAVDDAWWTGSPKHKPIDPRKIWYVSTDNLESKKDIVGVFHRETFTLDKFRQMYPKYYKMYGEAVTETTEEILDASYNYQMKLVDVVIYQFKVEEIMDQRVVANEETESMNMEYFTESEYEEYLTERGATPENIEEYKRAGEQSESNPVFEEKIRASVKLKRSESRWVQVVFIPELMVQLEEPELVGKLSDYIIMPGELNLESVYSTSEAYSYKDLLKISGVLLTTMMLNTIRLQKPIPIIIEGALKNEANFIENYYKTGVIGKVDPDWAKKNNNIKAVYWLEPPVAGQMQMMLFNLIQSMTDKSMSAPNVMRGVSDYSQQSGKQTELLQQQASQASKPDFKSIDTYLTQVCERFKNMIANKRDYPHNIFLPRESHIEGLSVQTERNAVIEVNTNNKNQFADIADKCFAKVVTPPNEQQEEQIKDMQYEKMYREGDISFDMFANNASWVDNPEKVIENHVNSQGDRAFAEMLSKNPDMKQQVIQFIQQMEQQQGGTANPQQTNDSVQM